MRAGAQEAKSGEHRCAHTYLQEYFGSLPAMQIQRRQEAGGLSTVRAPFCYKRLSSRVKLSMVKHSLDWIIFFSRHGGLTFSFSLFQRVSIVLVILRQVF